MATSPLSDVALLAEQSPAIPVPASAVSGSEQLYTGACIFYGIEGMNTGAAGHFVVYDGTDTTGAIVLAVSVTTDGAINALIGAPGILCQIGVFIVVTTSGPLNLSAILAPIPYTVNG